MLMKNLMLEAFLSSRGFHAWIVLKFYCFPAYLPDLGSLLLLKFHKLNEVKKKAYTPKTNQYLTPPSNNPTVQREIHLCVRNKVASFLFHECLGF